MSRSQFKAMLLVAFAASAIGPTPLLAEQVNAAGCSQCEAAQDPCGEGCDCEEATECCAPDESIARLFDSCWMQSHNVTVGGWINASYAWNPDNPSNGYNGPVTFQDRANEGQLNQLYGFAERSLDTDCGFDIGGRVDLLYGTDYFYTTALGLETETDGTQRWNRDKFSDPIRRAHQYGLAMPQLYAEFGYYNLSVKVGHYYAPVGYQTVTAPDNFFITQPYAFQYGEPFTLTGALATYTVSEQFAVLGGVDRGWDRFEDDNENVSGLVGFRWTSYDALTTVAWSGTGGKEQGISGVNGTRLLSSLVLTRELGQRWQYVIQNDIGWQDSAAVAPFGGPITNSEWYGINHYLYYKINSCWRAGARFEWFRDDDGTRVRFFDNLSDNEGHYYETALGLNYTPHYNLTIRSEARWDWSDASLPPASGTGFPFTLHPYEDLAGGSQFLWTTDVILQF